MCEKRYFASIKEAMMHALQEQFEEQGYVILKGIFGSDVLQGVKVELELLVSEDVVQDAEDWASRVFE
jgi:ribosomal protein L11 methylase PrmA